MIRLLHGGSVRWSVETATTVCEGFCPLQTEVIFVQLLYSIENFLFPPFRDREREIRHWNGSGGWVRNNPYETGCSKPTLWLHVAFYAFDDRHSLHHAQRTCIRGDETQK